MSVSFQIPESIERHLRTTLGDLDRLAKEAFAVEAFRASELSLGQFAEILGISRYEADRLLKQRGVTLDYSDEEIRAEVEFLEKRLSE